MDLAGRAEMDLASLPEIGEENFTLVDETTEVAVGEDLETATSVDRILSLKGASVTDSG